MALYVLFVAHGFNVNFHFCTENHHVMSSFGDASALCEHCLGHHHHEHLNTQESDERLEERHFNAKCCCEDFDSEIGFTEGFTFSTEKLSLVSLPNLIMMTMLHPLVDEMVTLSSQNRIWEKTPHFMTGRLKTIFFSSLKLNPLVF